MFSSFFYRIAITSILITSLTACGGTTSSDTNAVSDNTLGVINSNNKTGIVTLNWLPPTLNSDGSSLVDLAGYTIYYGQSPVLLSNTISVSNSGLTTFVIENLDSNTTYYFAVAAVNNQNIESNLSNVVNQLTNS